MRFKLPDSIRLSGFDIEIKYVDGEFGDYRGQSKTSPSRHILIDKSQDAQDIRASIIHEMLHQIDIIYDCKVSESVTKRLAHGINELIQQLEEDKDA